MQRVRALVAATIVGGALALFFMLWLHATREFGVIIACTVGLAIFVVVATGTDAHDGAADLAWREASLDLPPVSDRVILERMQARMPGPEKHHRSGARARAEIDDVGEEASSQAAEPK